MGFGVGDGGECRDMTIMVKQSVHFNAALGLTKRCPGEEGKAERDSGGVQGEELGFETALVFGSGRCT